MDQISNYYSFSRSEWQQFYRMGTPPLTDAELEAIKSLNDRISMADVEEIYVPLTHLIHVYMKEYESLQLSKGLFIQKYIGTTPFVIGIAGSVAVGKSTIARLLQILLSRIFQRKQVDLITTDGFLYPNHVLKEKKMMAKKGFPESYDMPRLIEFLNQLKSGVPHLKVPQYSHDIYDIIPDCYQIIDQPDILIVEGINVLQLPSNQQIYVSDFFDFSIYVDADPELIQTWYLERFSSLLDTAFLNPNNFYYQYAIGDRQEAFKMAKQVWKEVNEKNLIQNILPTKNRADIILHKTKGHRMDHISLRRY